MKIGGFPSPFIFYFFIHKDMRKTYTGFLISLLPNQYFVFGSNTQGRHGKGSALMAMQRFGAIYGQAYGLQGNSYAIVTKDLTKKEHPSIPEHNIVSQIEKLYEFAKAHPENEYYIAYKANSVPLNGYTPLQMATFFSFWGLNYIPDNIVFEDKFQSLILSLFS